MCASFLCLSFSTACASGSAPRTRALATCPKGAVAAKRGRGALWGRPWRMSVCFVSLTFPSSPTAAMRSYFLGFSSGPLRGHGRNPSAVLPVPCRCETFTPTAGLGKIRCRNGAIYPGAPLTKAGCGRAGAFEEELVGSPSDIAEVRSRESHASSNASLMLL